MFLLSHHPPEDWKKTYGLGRLRLCARCAGLYPTLLASWLSQGLWHAPVEQPADVFFGAAGVAVGALHWAQGQWAPWTGSNPGRTLTGAVMGLALGRSIYLHCLNPWPRTLLLQAIVITGIFLLAQVIRIRRTELDPLPDSSVSIAEATAHGTKEP